MPFLTDFFSIMRELSLDNLHDAAVEPPAILVVGDGQTRDQIVERFFGIEAQPYVRAVDAVPEKSKDEPPLDLLILAWEGQNEERLRRAAPVARSRGLPTVIVNTADRPLPESILPPGPVVRLPAAGHGEEWQRALRAVLAEMEEDRLLAVGRHMPATRPVVAHGLVQGTARANAQFATLSNLPALIPVLGNIIGATADFLVLTKNQLILLFKLAAVYGRDIEDRKKIYAEMVPVVGAGLVWRTVARELAALIPGLIGAVPKIAIAYTGTYVVGRSAQYYYEEGRAPTRENVQQFYQQALAWLKHVRQGDKKGRERLVVHSGGDTEVREVPEAATTTGTLR